MKNLLWKWRLSSSTQSVPSTRSWIGILLGAAVYLRLPGKRWTPPDLRKQAQGAVGNSQQLLYARVRTLRQDLADRYGTLVPITSPVFTWLVKHGQILLNKFGIRSDGLTPLERRWSKPYTSALWKFGESVLCRLRGKRPNCPWFVAG